MSSSPGLLPVSPSRFRSAIGTFATGVSVVTTSHAGQLLGMTMNSLTSVSLDPCLLLICPRRTSATGAAIRARGSFVVNLLASDQEEVARRFVGAEGRRFNGLDLGWTETGLPLLPGSLAQLTCELRQVHAGGDHDIMVGEVIACTDVSMQAALVFHRGSFGTYEPSLPGPARNALQ